MGESWRLERGREEGGVAAAVLLLYSCVSETVGFVSVLGKAGSICAEAGQKYIGEKSIPCLRFFFISFYDKVGGEGFYWVIFICKLDRLCFLGLGVTGG